MCVCVCVCVCREWPWELIRWHSISWEENIPSCSRFPSMTPQSGYDSETAAWPCVCGHVCMYVWTDMLSVWERTFSMRLSAHVHVRLGAQSDSGALWVWHTLQSDTKSTLMSSARSKLRQILFHVQDLSCNTDLFDSTGAATGFSRLLASKVLFKPGMGQDGGQLSINLHHLIGLWNAPTSHIIRFQWISCRHWAVLVLQDLQTLKQ